MTQEREDQLMWLQSEISKRVNDKFRRGAAEHDESLFRLDLVEEASWELIDGIIYLLMELKKRNENPQEA